MTLSRQILAKGRTLGISSNAELARRIGISLPTLYNVLWGRRTPNARTIDAYARFLSLSWDDVVILGRAPRSSRDSARASLSKRR